MKSIKEKLKLVDFDIVTTFLLSFIFLSISVTSVFFILGIGISSVYFPMYMFISAFITFFIFNKPKDNKLLKKLLINIFISIIILFIAILVGGIFYDETWDGNTYHKEMIGLMKKGMNPIYNISSGDIWTQHYARAVETFAAVIYAFTNNIENGKALGFLLIFLLFGQLYKYLRKKNINIAFSILFALAVALNPISLTQATCYYVDGIFANTLFFIILVLLKLTTENKDSKLYLYWLAGLIIVCVNIKFTSLLICTMFVGAFILYWLYISIKEKNFKATFKKWFIYFLSVYIFAVVFVGASVYIKNFVKYGHPFYPLLGEESGVDIVTDNEPAGLTEYNHVEKFLYTLFSKTYTWYDKKPELKIPFSIYKSEFDSMQYADTRVGGFGPWYSGMLILSIPVIVFYIIRNIQKKRRENILLILVVLFIILPIPILPVVWQLRYYPQLYLLPIIAIYLLLINNSNIFKKIYYVLLSLVIIGNIALYTPIMVDKFKSSININRELLFLYEQSLKNKVIISIEDCPNAGARYNFEDKNIKYDFLTERMKDGTHTYYRFYYKIEEGNK